MIVGLNGGQILKEVGSRFDVWAFFEAVAEKLENDNLGSLFPLVGDRLYKRYVALEELEPTKIEMNEIKSKLLKINTKNWLEKKIQFAEFDKKKSRLDLDGKNLADVFKIFFDGFYETYDSTVHFYKEYGDYIPLKIVYTDLPYYAFDKMRPLEDYDNLDGAPFWLRTPEPPRNLT